MSTPDNDLPSYGTLENLRLEAVEQLDLCAFHARLAADQGSVSADPGMSYNTRCAVAHLRMATEILKLMAEKKTANIAAAERRRPDGLMTGAERRGEHV